MDTQHKALVCIQHGEIVQEEQVYPDLFEVHCPTCNEPYRIVFGANFHEQQLTLLSYRVQQILKQIQIPEDKAFEVKTFGTSLPDAVYNLGELAHIFRVEETGG